jgi:hypothetical protein
MSAHSQENSPKNIARSMLKRASIASWEKERVNEKYSKNGEE